MRKVILMTLVLSSASFGCELTQSYKDIRSEIIKQVGKQYESCIDSVSSYYYWKSFSECIDKGYGKDFSGGCAHFANYNYLIGVDVEKEEKHCVILRNDKYKQARELLDYQVKDQKIIKCN